MYLVGISWTPEAKAEMQQKETFSINDCHLTMYYTCLPDLSDFYSVKIPPSPFRKKDTSCFLFMVLSTANQIDLWQTISCPMYFLR